MFILLPVLFLAASAVAARPGRANARQRETSADEPAMRSISTPDYVVHTDLPEDELGVVLQRLGAMTAEYRLRTSAISNRADDRRLPLYLYSKRDDFERAGGQKEAVGFFDGERLLACVGATADARAWHVIQHEAFHQFLIAKLGYEVPIWLNEGLADYFGESLYTGDGFVSGIVPQWRLRRLQQAIERARDAGLERLVSMTHEQWNGALRQESYDLAWSLVEFLAHGEDGAYQDGLTQYIRDSKKGGDPLRAFERTIGPVNDIQAKWRDYWLDYDQDESQRIYARAAAQTVCSFVARAMASHTTVKDLGELSQFAEQARPKPAKGELAPAILADCLEWSRDMGQWTLDQSPRAPFQVQLKMKDGTSVYARCVLRNASVQSVESWIGSAQTTPAKRRR